MTLKRTNKHVWLVLVVLFLFVSSDAFAARIYVDGGASGIGDGSSWANAYNYLQDALTAASSGDEIWVAQGIYVPDRGVGITRGDRAATFALQNGVVLYGGLPSGGAWEARDPNIYETILSGDLDTNDVGVTDPCDLLDEPTRGENSYHVVTGSGTDETAVLDGFTITAGNANESEPHDRGGGIYCGNESSPIIDNCTVKANASTYAGGGIFCDVKSYPTVKWCTISGNSSDDGGGIDCFDESSPTIEYCTVQSNTTTGDGGGIYCDENSHPTIKYCTIADNSSDDGGGIECWMSRPIITQCIIVGNIAVSEGGAIEYDTCNSVTILNCTIMGNQAFVGGGICYDESDGEIENCIVWMNTATIGPTIALEEYMGDTSFVTVTYTDVWAGLESVYLEAACVLDWGIGNISADPLFADPNKSDYHLKSEVGRWDPNNQTWIQDEGTSPCIDSADPNSPVGDEPVPNGGRMNIGAYGSTSQASMSLSGAGNVADFCGPNFGPQDGYVDVWDLMQFADHWHARTGEGNWDATFDLAGPNFGDLDGYIDVWDLMTFADHWHEGEPP